MIFRVELDGESIQCSSPRCIEKLIAQGWSLCDPEQKEALARLASAERASGEPGTLHPRSATEAVALAELDAAS